MASVDGLSVNDVFRSETDAFLSGTGTGVVEGFSFVIETLSATGASGT